MQLSDLLQLYAQSPNVRALIDFLKGQESSIITQGLIGSQKAMISSTIFKEVGRSHLFILNDKEEAAYFENDISNLLEKKDILFFPDSFKKVGQFEEVNKNNIRLRTETLNRLMHSQTRGEIIVSYPEALVEKIVEAKKLSENIIHMNVGEKLDVDFIVDLLVEYGFKRTDFVYEPGEFSIRGGIVDIFSFGNDFPYRVELFDDEVESLRTFDPESQLSKKRIKELTIIPDINTQFSKELNATIFDFTPENLIIWVNDFSITKDLLQNLYEKALEEFSRLELVDVDEDHPFKQQKIDAVFEKKENILEHFNKYQKIYFKKDTRTTALKVIDFDATPQPNFNRNFDLLISDLNGNTLNNTLNFLFTENVKQIERFYHIFEDSGKEVQFHPVSKALSVGFVDRDLKLVCYTDHQIFNRFHKYTLKQGYNKSKALSIKALRDLQPGDYVTHIDHGVGVFSGLERIEVNGQQQEAVRLKYQNNDLLYVNINSLHKISKYSGKEGQVPRINKLGSDAWQNLKRKTKRKVRDIAKELIALYAKRKAQVGFQFSEDSYLQDELEASFIYEDTPDQLKATQSVKADMEKNVPMDRLVCGDVGFGKTEVAIRAAFKAVADNKQVAVLVPTTILALQHYKTFSKRLENYPCTVDYLNRFKTTKQKNETLKGLADGTIDIVIGTHALLGKKTMFKNLGLLIIDEEQKFGVGAKEKLRSLAVNIDTLTLTATPIPRTLKFSLMGARDFSIMQTPPPNRQPVTTEVHPFDHRLIKEAIEYEVYRGGQVFFVHNRIKDIVEIEIMLKKILPNIEIEVAHGQMDGKKLESKMLDFIDGKFDLLLSTNIVESGLDIPNANTIIINNAHHFGLSDLHQLRGRVGRSNKKAFCYLFSPPMSTLTTDARRRLKTLEEFSDLGSGFNIAMRDMDIRGAGNLLGAEQSGFIADIGFDMYHKILDEAIQELKYTEFKELFKEEIASKEEFVNDCQIDTDVEMLIPQSYVTNGEERLRLYTEMDNLSEEEHLLTFKTKMIDRFGPLPHAVEELFNGLRLRWLAKKIGFERLSLKRKKLRCYFISKQDSPYYESAIFQLVLNYVQKQNRRSTLKQTPKHLLLVFENVKNVTFAKLLLEDLLEQISE